MRFSLHQCIAVFVSSRNAPERRSGPFQFKAAGLINHCYFNLSRI